MASDVLRSAHLLPKQHGKEAASVAAKRADRCSVVEADCRSDAGVVEGKAPGEGEHVNWLMPGVEGDQEYGSDTRAEGSSIHVDRRGGRKQADDWRVVKKFTPA